MASTATRRVHPVPPPCRRARSRVPVAVTTGDRRQPADLDRHQRRQYSGGEVRHAGHHRARAWWSPMPPGPMADVTVTFTVTAGGGTVTGGTTTTDAQGIATVGGWTLGPRTRRQHPQGHRRQHLDQHHCDGGDRPTVGHVHRRGQQPDLGTGQPGAGRTDGGRDRRPVPRARRPCACSLSRPAVAAFRVPIRPPAVTASRSVGGWRLGDATTNTLTATVLEYGDRAGHLHRHRRAAGHFRRDQGRRRQPDRLRRQLRRQEAHRRPC